MPIDHIPKRTSDLHDLDTCWIYSPCAYCTGTGSERLVLGYTADEFSEVCMTESAVGDRLQTFYLQ